MQKDKMTHYGVRALGGAIGAILLGSLVYILLGEPETEEAVPWVEEEKDGEEHSV